MNFKLLTVLMFMSSSFAFAQQSINPQLVIIPKGHSAPVPFEAVSAWETGKYRNFFKLPCINGNTEPRAEFDKDYACHALKWLDLVKEVSPILYNDLIAAAKKTHFSILDNYILWEHKAYPEGEINYKKYEKAAFYNGEIILSTLVMDRVGPLANVLTKEQNQGYIILHELINALYPKQSVKWKLDLGEVFIQKVIFKKSKKETLTQLALINPYYLEGETNYPLLYSVMDEVGTITGKNSYYSASSATKFVLKNYLLRNVPLRQAYVDFMTATPIKNESDFAERDDMFVYAFRYTLVGNSDLKEIMDINLLKEVSHIHRLNYSVYTRSASPAARDILTVEFKKDATQILNETAPKVFQTIESLDSNIFSDSFFETTFFGVSSDYFTEDTFEKFLKTHFYAMAESLVNRATANEITFSYFLTDYINNNSKILAEGLNQQFQKSFERRGMDYKRTVAFVKWHTGSATTSSAESAPLIEGDRFYMGGRSNTIYKVLKIVLKGDRYKNRYKVQNTKTGSTDTDFNLPRNIIILKAQR